MKLKSLSPGGNTRIDHDGGTGQRIAGWPAHCDFRHSKRCRGSGHRHPGDRSERVGKRRRVGKKNRLTIALRNISLSSKRAVLLKKDINSANLRTQPDYDYQNGKSILKGYRAVRTVEVTLRQLDKLNGLLDGALKAGLNEIRSVSLGVAQPDAYKDKARKAAIDDAVHQAQELAAGFHSKLGPVYSVRYHVSNYQPSPMVRMMKAADAAPVSAQETYEQATIQFDDQVDVVFELQPAQAAAPATPAKPAETPKPAQ